MIGSYAPPEVAPHFAKFRDIEASTRGGGKVGNDLASDLVHMRHSDIPTAVDKLDAATRAAGEKAQPGRQSGVIGEQRRSVGTHAEECGMTEAYLTGKPEEQVPARRQDGKYH